MHPSQGPCGPSWRSDWSALTRLERSACFAWSIIYSYAFRSPWEDLIASFYHYFPSAMSHGTWTCKTRHAQKFLVVRFGNRGALLPSLRKRRRTSHFPKKSILFPKDVSGSRQPFHRQGSLGQTVSFRSIASPTPSTHTYAQYTHTRAELDKS